MPHPAKRPSAKIRVENFIKPPILKSMSDLDKTSAAFFNRMAANPVPVNNAQVQQVGQPSGPGVWGAMLQYLKGNPSAEALPTQNVKPGPAVDPYANFANRATGQPFK